MNLQKLNEPLSMGQLEFKVNQVEKGQDAIWATIIAYKNARTDMEILDEAVGQLNWQCTYQRDSKGILQCSIGIWDETKALGAGEWVWKTSNGIPSNFEKEKGEYSDAFKRCSTLWGIGRQVYDFPTIRIQLNEKDYYLDKGGNVKLSRWFRPNDWDWFVSPDYQHVKAERKYGNTYKTVFDNNPYKKDE